MKSLAFQLVTASCDCACSNGGSEILNRKQNIKNILCNKGKDDVMTLTTMLLYIVYD